MLTVRKAIIHRTLRFLLTPFLLLGVFHFAHGQEVPAGASLAGYTGLLDMPNARVMPDWNIRPYYSSHEPYYTFGVAASILPRLEVNGRITGISGRKSGFGDSYGDDKDKAIDFKLQLLNEGDYLPALAFGATDVHGTALFSSRYLTASKNVGWFDLTAGIGQGILAGEKTSGAGSGGAASDDAGFTFLVSNPLDHPARVFGGGEFFISNTLSLVGEYSSLDYKNMYGGPETQEPKANVNVGVRYTPWPFLTLNGSLLRGNVLGWSISSQLPLQPEGMLPWKPQPFWNPDEDLKTKARNATSAELAIILRDEVTAERFTMVKTSVSDASVWVEIQNPTYLSNTKALGRALRAVCALAPPRIEWLYISLKSRDIIFLTIKLSRKDFETYIDNRMDDSVLLHYTETSREGDKSRQAFLAGELHATPLTEAQSTKKYAFSAKPNLQTFFNDPSGFLKHKFSFIWNASLFPWAGSFVRGSIRTPIYSGITGIKKTPEENAVRSDSSEYLEKTEIRLEVLAFDQVFDLPAHFLGRVELGLFETAYGGIAGEVYRPFHEGNWGLGLEAVAARKRDPEENFSLGEDNYYNVFLKIYHNLVPALGLETEVKLGRFLGGDWGGRFDISRTFRYFTLGAWYTVTDSQEVFTASFNKGYHDKGVYLRVPFSIFTDHDSPTTLSYGLRPWGRDTGQEIGQINSLSPMSRVGSIDNLKRTLGDLKK